VAKTDSVVLDYEKRRILSSWKFIQSVLKDCSYNSNDVVHLLASGSGINKPAKPQTNHVNTKKYRVPLKTAHP